MRRLILNLHLVIGILAGVFVALLGGTGSILAFEPELDRLLHREVSYIRPGPRTLSLKELGTAISNKYPAEAIVTYLPSTTPDFPTQVILSRGIVSINQYTGAILGTRPRGQSFLGIVRALHVRLAMGDIGRVILKCSAVAILLSLFSGLYLWWPLRRMRIGGPRWTARFWYDLHSSIGFFSLLPMLVLAGTGVVLGFEDQAVWLIDKTTMAGTTHGDQFHLVAESNPIQIDPDQAVGIASRQVPGGVPYRVQMPKYGGLYIIAFEKKETRITGERNFVSLDPSGRIVSVHLSSDLSRGERFIAASDALHTGTAFGVPSRIIAAIVSILLPLQAVSGLLIWLRRKGLFRAA